jgi:hypothetical protein
LLSFFAPAVMQSLATSCWQRKSGLHGVTICMRPISRPILFDWELPMNWSNRITPCDNTSGGTYPILWEAGVQAHCRPLLRALLRPQLWHCLELGLLANIAVKLLHVLFCLAVLLACKLRKRQLQLASPGATTPQVRPQPLGSASGASTGKVSKPTCHPSPRSHQSSSSTLEQQLPQWAITARPWVVGLSSLMPQLGLLLGVLLQPLPAPLMPHSLAYAHSGSASRPLLFAFYSLQAINMPVSGESLLLPTFSPNALYTLSVCSDFAYQLAVCTCLSLQCRSSMTLRWLSISASTSPLTLTSPSARCSCLCPPTQPCSCSSGPSSLQRGAWWTSSWGPAPPWAYPSLSGPLQRAGRHTGAGRIRGSRP